MTQRFYPQCVSCSSKQGALLSERAALARRLGSMRRALAAPTAASPAVLHLPSPLRPQHAVGAVLETLARAAPEAWELADAAISAWLAAAREMLTHLSQPQRARAADAESH